LAELAYYGLEQVMRIVIWRNIHAGLYENNRLMMNQIPHSVLDFIFWSPILIWYGQRRFKTGLVLGTIWLLLIFGGHASSYMRPDHYEIGIYSACVVVVLLMIAANDLWICLKRRSPKQ
jgi:hypothetical protein